MIIKQYYEDQKLKAEHDKELEKLKKQSLTKPLSEYAPKAKGGD